MNLLYISTVDCAQASGVRNKIYGQIDVMRNAGINVGLLCAWGEQIAIKKSDKVKKLSTFKNKGPFRYFNLSSMLYSTVYRYVVENRIDGVYIRYSISDPSFINMLKRLRKKSIKIFIEIPTYPYDLEYANKQWYKRIGLYIDRIFRKRLYKYTDRIYTPSPNQKNIFGVETIFFENGINTNTVKMRRYRGGKKDTLRFIGVANINSWHGYDRVITGISKYSEKGCKKNIVFNVVGDGVELPNLKRLANKLNIEDKIVFHGGKFGKELDELYDTSDIAVSSIGFFRLKSIPSTILKTREACLKGIPFIYLKGDPSFESDFKYAFVVEDIDEPLNIEKIYDWFIKLNPNEYIKEMNKFAQKHLGWDNTFKVVISDIKKSIAND